VVHNFGTQLSGFRRCSGQVTDTSGSDLKSRTMNIQCPAFASHMLTPDYSALLVQSFRSWIIKFDIISRASCIHEPSERNSANSAMKTLTSAETSLNNFELTVFIKPLQIHRCRHQIIYTVDFEVRPNHFRSFVTKHIKVTKSLIIQ